jgi:hypothetical protein
MFTQKRIKIYCKGLKIIPLFCSLNQEKIWDRKAPFYGYEIRWINYGISAFCFEPGGILYIKVTGRNCGTNYLYREVEI